MQSISKFLFAATLFALFGCSGSNGNNLPSGLQCGAGYNPIPQSTNSWQKELRKDAKDPEMPAGRYTYNFSDLVYIQNKAQNPFTIQVRDNSVAGVSAAQAVYCMRNLPQKPEVAAFEMDAVTDIIICNDLHQVITTRRFKFDITDSTVHFTAPAKNPSCTDSTINAYPKGPFMIIKNLTNLADFEVRSEVTLPDSSAKYDLGVHMTYQAFGKGNPEPPECANKCASTPPEGTSPL